MHQHVIGQRIDRKFPVFWKGDANIRIIHIFGKRHNSIKNKKNIVWDYALRNMKQSNRAFATTVKTVVYLKNVNDNNIQVV